MQRAALERTHRIIVIADGSKVGTATPIVIGPAATAAMLITDPSAPAAELRELRRLGIDVLIAERAAPAKLEPAPTPLAVAQ